MKNGRTERGFTYIMALVLVAVLGITLAAAGEIWSVRAQREKEVELLWVGKQYQQAIGAYYHLAGGAKRFPRSLEDLLEDRRGVVTLHYLRKLYPDPITGTPEWDLISAPDGGIMGVRSRSRAKPLRQTGTDESSYSDWGFLYEPPAPVAMPSARSAR